MTQPTDTLTPNEVRDLAQVIIDHMQRGLLVNLYACFADNSGEIVASWSREGEADPWPLWTRGDLRNSPGTLDDLKGALRQHAKGAKP